LINTQNKGFEYAQQVRAYWDFLNQIAINYPRTAIPKILQKQTASSVKEFFVVSYRIDHYCMHPGLRKPELINKGLSEATVIERLIKENWTDEKGMSIC